MTFRIAIAGASGYAGGEMARLVSTHPSFELGALTAHSNEGRAVRDVHPHLRSVGDVEFKPTDVATLADHHNQICFSTLQINFCKIITSR